MHKRLWLAGLLVLLASQIPAPAEEDVAAVLRRQTQEMLDAISSGTAAVWARYLDDKAIYTAEDGSVVSKAQMVEQIRPLPAGVSGVLRILDFQTHVHGPVAVASYLIDENEDYHGHKLHCQYRTTDTWRQTPAGWRLVAGQVLALRKDPPALPLPARQAAEYTGRYALTPSITYEIRQKEGGLEGQQAGRPPETLKAEVADVLFVPGRPRYRKIFQRGPDGLITGFIERREAWDLVWTRLPDAAPPG